MKCPNPKCKRETTVKFVPDGMTREMCPACAPPGTTVAGVPLSQLLDAQPVIAGGVKKER